ncbi:MAG: lysylphosphatidylglycerol synthase domain-containing protein [Streptosporangiaceae bacterium]
MRSPRPGPHPGDHAGTTDQVDVARAPRLVVQDHRARRIRRPIDLLRCLVAILGVFVVAGIGLLARATATGIESDAVDASLRLPHPVLALLGIAADFALLLWPAALAIRQVSRHQARRIVEAVLTAAGAIALIALANVALRGVAGPLYDAVAMPPSGPGISGPLDGYLAGLAAYATIIGLTGPSRWRTTLWLTVGVYGLANLATASVTVPSFLITLLLGRAIGLGVRYAAGEWSQRPTAEEIASALNSAGHPVVAMRRTRQDGIESRHYAATARGGGRLDVRVYDRDQEAAGALYRLYRRLRLQGPVRRGVPLSQERAVERRALLAYAADEAGVRTPRLVALVSVGGDANALAYEHHRGTTLAELAGVLPDSGSAEPDDAATPRSNPAAAQAAAIAGSQAAAIAGSQSADDQRGATTGSRPADEHRARATDSRPTDDQLLRVWEAVLRLHAHRVTHRTLTADHILFADDGDVVLLDPGGGDVAASDLQIRLDLTQLLAELALLVGPDRAARLATKAVGADELAAVVPLLQPIVLHRSTRSALRRRKDVLPALRTQLLAAAPGEDAAPVRLERVRPRTIVTLIASLIAGYFLLGQLGRVNLISTLRSADWHWTLLALALSGVTYLGAALALSGYVPDRLRFRPLVLAQLAGSFVTLVTPAAVGGAALNIRYLQRRKVPAAVAAASVGLSQVVAFVLHILLIVVFAAITGSQGHSLQPPNWVYFVIAALIVVVLAVVAIPAGRRLLRARLAPVLGQVLPRLLAVVQQPRKLAEGIGGALLLDGAYILCLAACIQALGGSASLASIALVYLTGSALGSAVPTPGGLGAVEAALSAGLTAAGLPGATAVSAVLLFRTLTFWLPVPVGWGAFNYLERHEYL